MGKQWKQWQTLFLGGSKITADSDCSHEIKRRLLLGRKTMTNLDSILKGRDITLPTKIRLVKAMVFPIVMYGCESWTIKKAERWRIDAFEPWCCAGSQWGIPLMTKVMRKEARHTQRRDRASGVPLDILEHLPPKKLESAYFIALCSHLWLYWGLSPTTISLSMSKS